MERMRRRVVMEEVSVGGEFGDEVMVCFWCWARLLLSGRFQERGVWANNGGERSGSADEGREGSTWSSLY